MVGGCLIAVIGQVEFGNVTAGGKRKPKLMLMFRDGVVLGNALADFGGRNPDDRINRGVIIGASSEDLDSDRPFFELIGAAREGMFDNKSKKGGESTAVVEGRAFDQALQLFADSSGGDSPMFFGAHVLLVYAHSGPRNDRLSG